MELYERIFRLGQKPAEIAKWCAEYMLMPEEYDYGRICPDLMAILLKLGEIRREGEIEKNLMRNACPPWVDFDGIEDAENGEPAGISPGQESERLEWHKDREKESEGILLRLDEKAKALEDLFRGICRELRANRITITGGEISALKRIGVPESLVNALDGIKRGHTARIPQDERLNSERVEAIYAGLARSGLISGPYEAFCYHFGQSVGEAINRPVEGLKWHGNLADLAYFIRRFSTFSQRQEGGEIGFYNRVTPICRAFGITDKQQKSIPPYISRKAGAKRAAVIDAVFYAAKGDKTQKE